MPTDPLPEPPMPTLSRPYARLFAVSFLILFFELACIRWFGSTVIFLTFFTNLVLLACFLGMSVGCLAAQRPRSLIRSTLPLTLLVAALALGTLQAYERDDRFMVDVGDQRSPQLVYFGTEARPKDPSKFVVPLEVVAGVFFALIALGFVGPGQELGRAFDAIPDRIGAYTVNVAGSMVGIVAFGALSYARMPPVVWFAIVVVLIGLILPRRSLWQAIAGLGLLALLASPADRNPTRERPVWSPYYKVDYGLNDRTIYVNNIIHQIMGSIGQNAPLYTLPYFLNRDAGRPPFRDVLIIGAGSGNDVAAALSQGARRVDAVEIDPVIRTLGRTHHPNRPYADPRVVSHLDDGRSFVRKTDRRFDLAVYALVDSLVLHSGYSSIRLESFLFTEQAFRDIHARLAPDGVFFLYNYYRQGWVVGRIAAMAEKVFGTKPLIMSIPYQPRIAPTDRQEQRITLIMIGKPGNRTVPAIRAALEASGGFWSNVGPQANSQVNGYGPRPPFVAGVPPGGWFRIAPAEVVTSGIGPLPSDDWPFLYLREPAIPFLTYRGMAIVAVISLALLLVFAPVRTVRPSGAMFFLGAGFMLLETKGVVHMALLFGSTWVVNSVVFFAILGMILLANLLVALRPPHRLWPYDLALLASLLANAFIPMTSFLALEGPARIAASCAVVFLPVLFAGVIFATTFRRSARPDVALGSNIAGAILGGLSENASLILGFDRLLLVALAFYAAAALFRSRSA